MDAKPARLLWRQRSVFDAPPPSPKHNTRDPTRTALYQLVAEQYQTFIEAAQLCAHIDGFDLHGRVAFGAGQRARIEQLVRYCARPPLANDLVAGGARRPSQAMST